MGLKDTSVPERYLRGGWVPVHFFSIMHTVDKVSVVKRGLDLSHLTALKNVVFFLPVDFSF